jgi:hypothetical protein
LINIKLPPSPGATNGGAPMFTRIGVVAVSVFVASLAFAQDRVDVQGCVRKGVEAKCLMLEASDGTKYNITSIKPRPKVDYLGIQVSGVKSSDPDTCQEGTLLKDIKWNGKYTKQNCKKPKTK